ncbi:hypothetical protein CYMTET_36478 [Cymbomonas tetramitiformis]|uniref:Uncharacterized protein n=1 Tax=Cymbomonas tetramitiformis TaxID=36881 RepID=A0AAE0CI77_9CHLO|nr:hypothetical protein CYMTET_36478 [Cymbomonas tetramitiformis]
MGMMVPHGANDVAAAIHGVSPHGRQHGHNDSPRRLMDFIQAQRQRAHTPPSRPQPQSQYQDPHMSPYSFQGPTYRPSPPRGSAVGVPTGVLTSTQAFSLLAQGVGHAEQEWTENLRYWFVQDVIQPLNRMIQHSEHMLNELYRHLRSADPSFEQTLPATLTFTPLTRLGNQHATAHESAMHTRGHTMGGPQHQGALGGLQALGSPLAGAAGQAQAGHPGHPRPDPNTLMLQQVVAKLEQWLGTSTGRPQIGNMDQFQLQQAVGLPPQFAAKVDPSSVHGQYQEQFRKIVEQLRKEINNYIHIMELLRGQTVLGLLPTCVFPAYTVERIQQLAEGSFMKCFTPEGGGSWNGHAWNAELPNDSQLLLYLFCVFLKNPGWEWKPEEQHRLYLGRIPPIGDKYVAIARERPPSFHTDATVVVMNLHTGELPLHLQHGVVTGLHLSPQQAFAAQPQPLSFSFITSIDPSQRTAADAGLPPGADGREHPHQVQAILQGPKADPHRAIRAKVDPHRAIRAEVRFTPSLTS